MQVRVELVLRLDVEDAALPARVGGLQDRGHADRVERGARAQEVACAGKGGLRHAGVGERPPHRDLVGHQVGGVGADPGQAERLGDGRHDGNGAVGRDGEDAVDRVPAPDLRDRVDVREVDRLALVGDGEPERVRVAVDGDDAQAELLRAQDRAALMTACADEENGAHVAGDARWSIGDARASGAFQTKPGPHSHAAGCLGKGEGVPAPRLGRHRECGNCRSTIWASVARTVSTTAIGVPERLRYESAEPKPGSRKAIRFARVI